MTWIEYLDSTNWHQAAAFAVCAYVLGCFTAGYYLVRLRTGTDVREFGSGSVGARNVGRVLGKTGFLLTLLFDVGKGALAVFAARHFTADDRLIAIAMLAVVSGHIWPAQLRFHGGKGMATSLGCLLVYDAQLAVTFAAVFLCLLALFRKSVLPGLLALALVPVAAKFFDHDRAGVIQLSVLAGLVLFAHRKNIFDELLQFSPGHPVDSKPDP